MTNSPELKITGVKTSEYRSGIPLQGWENVESALKLFESGAARKSNGVLQHEVKAYGDAYGELGTALFLLGNSQGRGSFVDKLLKEAKPSVQNRGQWKRHYDYDGPGRFHKTSVEIEALPNLEDGYLLGLNAAYVGKEVEDGLAETLGIEQGLQWKSVNIELKPVGTYFRIDFDAVAERLQPLYTELDPAPTSEHRGFRQRLVEVVRGKQPTEKPALTGEAIVRTLLATDEYTSGSNPFVLGIKDGVEVSLNLGRVGDRFNWRNGNKSEELWKAEGAVLSGPLAESYSDKGGLETPSLTVSIKPYSEDRYDRSPAIDPEMKATMNGLAEKAVAVFQPI